MARLVTAFAASHGPAMLLEPNAPTVAQRKPVEAAYRELGQRLVSSDLQALVLITTDHLQNFFVDNLPAICIGCADSYPTPAEAWLKSIVPSRVLPGAGALGDYLLRSAFEAGFDPAFSRGLRLDHGSLTPFHMAGIEPPPLVPIVINSVEPPLPTMRRCLQFGSFIGQALRAYSGLERIGLLATGGLSHDIGTPTMGRIDAEFDRRFLKLLADDDLDALACFCTDAAPLAGNGTAEVRNWLVARAAVGSMPLRVLHYDAIEAWLMGTAVVEWTHAS